MRTEEKMRKLVIAASIHLSLLTAAGLTAASAAELTVTIDGARNANGSIAAGIFASESGFPKPEQVFAAFRIKAKQGPVSFTVHNLPPGRYAVTAYHDENNNGKLDADVTGAPTEGYGVSNNAREILSPPFWSKASFEVGEPSKTVTVKVEY
jgi:uncharacterized protein (DUF2141 family)